MSKSYYANTFFVYKRLTIASISNLILRLRVVLRENVHYVLLMIATRGVPSEWFSLFEIRISYELIIETASGCRCYLPTATTQNLHEIINYASHCYILLQLIMFTVHWINYILVSDILIISFTSTLKLLWQSRVPNLLWDIYRFVLILNTQICFVYM